LQKECSRDDIRIKRWQLHPSAFNQAATFQTESCQTYKTGVLRDIEQAGISQDKV
jgi:hypothetical protein